MKQQEVFKKIGGIIKELNEQYEYLQTVDGQLNDLELELFIANSHFLTDHLVILTKLNSQLSPAPKVEPRIEKEPELKSEPIPEPTAQPAIKEEKYFEPLVQAAPGTKNKIAKPEVDLPVEDTELGNGINIEGTTEDSYSFMQEEPDTIKHELILDEAIEEEGDNDTEIGEEIEMPPVPDKFTAKKEPVATELEDVLTVNQKMSAQADENNGQRLGVQTISDLKTAINLNDKMLYVKDLFNGYNLAYSEAIEILNRFKSFDEAELFLKKNYVAKNNWEAKPDTTAKFYALLKRRYV